jgi:dipeptidyl aminopeptidase/acylaminoacyl peptidase
MPKPDRAFSVDDLWQIERLSGLDLSPDGAQAVCSLGRYDMTDNSARSSLWLLSTLGGKPRALTHCGDKDGQARWSPRGDEIAFVTKRLWHGKQDESPQLYLIAPDGGEARRISDFAPGIESYRWFPDGKRIAFIAWVWPELKGSKAQAKRLAAFKARKETGYVTSEAQYRYWDHNLPMGRVAHLHVLDVATGRVTDLFEDSDWQLPRSAPDATLFDIAPDGQHIVFCCDPSADQRIEHCKVLVEVKLRSGKFKVVAQAEGWDLSAPRFRPDGRALALLASHQGKKHTEPEQLSVLPRGEAWSPGDHLVAADWDHVPHAPLHWSRDGAALWFGAEARGRCHLWRFELATRSASVVLHGGNVQELALAADDQGGQTAVVLADAMDRPARALVVRAGQDARRIESFNDKLLSRFAFGATEEVTLAGAQGDPVQMWVVYPPGFDKRKTYPVLHSIHGGPHAASMDSFHYRWNNQLFAAQGYVVACVNYHGSSGFGQAFLDSITHRWGELELQDIEAGTDWLLEQPWADPKRVFATGGSYGGYMVAWMNGHVAPGRYQA